MNKDIIAVDFDGTCVVHDYPNIGPDVPNAVNVLKKLNQSGVRIILWTMRNGKELKDAEKWFKDRDVKLWAVNSNPEQKTWTKSPKAYAHMYIDDAALGCPLSHVASRPYVDWYRVETMLKAQQLIIEI